MVRKFTGPLLLVMALMLQGCGAMLRSTLNRKFPPVSSLERKVEALEMQTAALTDINKPDFGFQLDKALVQKQLEDFVGSQLSLDGSSIDPSIKSIKLDNLKLFFEAQEIGVQSLVTLQFNHKKIKSIQIQVKGFISPYLYRDTLSFVPVLQELRVKKVRLKGLFKSIAVLRPLVNGLLRRYFDNLNGQMKFYNIPLPQELMPKQLLSALLSHAPEVEVVNDYTIDFKRKIGPVAILIDDFGLQIIGELVLPNVPIERQAPQQFHDELLVEKEGDLQQQGSMVKQRLQQLQTQDSSWLSAKQSLSIYQRNTFFESGNTIPEFDSLQVVTSAPVDFNILFQEYKQRYGEYWISALDVPADSHSTVFLFSKFFISRTINELLLDPNFIVRYNIAPFDKKIPKQHFEIVERPDFNCRNVLHSCNTDNCGGVMRKCKSCKWYDAPCHVGWAACNAANGVRWAACQAGNATKLAACALDNTARFTWCTGVFLVQLAAHHVLNIGDLSGNIRGSGAITARLGGLAFDDQIDSFSLDVGLNCKGNVDVDLDFVPQGLITWLTCSIGIHQIFHSNISASLDTRTITGQLIKDNDEHSNARATFRTDPVPVHIQITPSPVEQLLSKPEVAFGCSFVVFGITVYSVLAPLANFPDWKRNLTLLWEGAYDHNFESMEFKLSFPDLNVPVGNETKVIKSQWGNQSLNFSLTSNP